ncbi:MAG: nucleotidyltransferase domain-containing protein [Steroidobacteraceae bacterium]|nr:nucleotidyltransferase domain-containing protein [Steroidobacteraceae bacterium]
MYLFGSRAKGTSRLDSDLDVAVLFTEPFRDPPQRMDCGMRPMGPGEWHWSDVSHAWKSELEALIPLELDFQHLDPWSSPHVREYVIEFGTCIYDAAAAQAPG